MLARMGILVFVVGLCFGSFLTLVSYRLPRGESMGWTRSRCPACGTTLAARDLVPVFSWAASRGACRHCRAGVSWRYPAIELVTAAALTSVYALYGLDGKALLLMGLTLALLVMIIVDFEHYIIPDSIQLLVGALGVGYHWCYGMHPADVLVGALTGGAIGWALQTGYRYARKKDGLGTGDVKFLVVAGIWLGAKMLIPLLFFSGLLGVVTAGLWRRLGYGEIFPFGPALAVSLWGLVMVPPIGTLFFQWPQLFLRG
jgi:prepilin signal peptidase PulO-like enzyme (type II secretory pathway)